MTLPMVLQILAVKYVVGILSMDNQDDTTLEQKNIKQP
jgi:hypothetical protein